MSQGAAGRLSGFALPLAALLTKNLLWDNSLMPRWLGTLLLAMIGIAAGIAYGWYVSPVEYVDTTPASLRIDYRADYVLMVAERFRQDGDRQAAYGRLAALDGPSPAAVCAEALGFARASSYAAGDVQLLEDLDRAMQALSSVPTPAAVIP